MNLKVATLVTALAASAALPLEAQVKVSRDAFSSGGRKIGVESFRVEGTGTFPAVIVLHGAGGIGYGNGHIRQLAEAFASNGFATFLVHYFDRTNQTWASDESIRSNFETWLSTITDAVSFVARQPGVDETRIATLGFSLGAYLAVAHAAGDARIRAVIELAGGIDPTHASRAKRLPPTLILHGQDDRRVLVERARELERLLRKLGAPHRIRLYPGEGHLLSPLAAFDALGRGLAFLREFLLDAPQSAAADTGG